MAVGLCVAQGRHFERLPRGSIELLGPQIYKYHWRWQRAWIRVRIRVRVRVRRPKWVKFDDGYAISELNVEMHNDERDN